VFKFPFIPREEKFFGLFEQSAHNMVNAAQALNELVDIWDNIEGRVDEIAKLEDEGDTITHQIIHRLNLTFVTPFDREDIVRLAESLDDVVDFIHAAATRMFIYRIDRSTPRAKELADILVQATTEIEKAMPLLRHRAELGKVLPRCVEINRLENTADEVYRSALAELFDETKDMAQIIKWREIYEHLETATDRCEDVSNALEGVALKYA